MPKTIWSRATAKQSVAHVDKPVDMESAVVGELHERVIDRLVWDLRCVFEDGVLVSVGLVVDPLWLEIYDERMGLVEAGVRWSVVHSLVAMGWGEGAAERLEKHLVMEKMPVLGTLQMGGSPGGGY